MKKLTLIISALAFSAVSFAQTTEIEKKAIEREAQIVNGTATPVEQINEQDARNEHQVPLRAVDQNSRMSTGTRMDNATEIQGRKLSRDGKQVDDGQIDPSETVPVSNRLEGEINTEDSKLQEASPATRQAQPKNSTTTPRQ